MGGRKKSALLADNQSDIQRQVPPVAENPPGSNTGEGIEKYRFPVLPTEDRTRPHLSVFETDWKPR